MSLAANLTVAGILVILTFAIHFIGLVGLSWVMRRRYMRNPKRFSAMPWQGVTIVFIVVGLFALHSLEIWLYALTYLALGQFDALDTALYFSTSTFTTVGFGDIVLSEDWRMLSAAQSANGFLLIGWSTAFLVSVTARVRLFEAEVVEATPIER